GIEIEPLAREFVQHFCRSLERRQPEIAAAAIERLTKHSWPGNVRELRNVIERAVLLCGPGPIAPEHLQLEVLAAVTVAHGTPPPPPTLHDRDEQNRERRPRHRRPSTLQDAAATAAAAAAEAAARGPGARRSDGCRPATRGDPRRGGRDRDRVESVAGRVLQRL